MIGPDPGAEKLDGPDFVSTLFVESKGVAGFIATTEQDRLLSNAAERNIARGNKRFWEAPVEVTYTWPLNESLGGRASTSKGSDHPKPPRPTRWARVVIDIQQPGFRDLSPSAIVAPDTSARKERRPLSIPETVNSSSRPLDWFKGIRNQPLHLAANSIAFFHQLHKGLSKSTRHFKRKWSENDPPVEATSVSRLTISAFR